MGCLRVNPSKGGGIGKSTPRLTLDPPRCKPVAAPRAASLTERRTPRYPVAGDALMSVGGLIWTALAGWYALWGAVIPFGYVLVTVANFAWF